MSPAPPAQCASVAQQPTASCTDLPFNPSSAVTVRRQIHLQSLQITRSTTHCQLMCHKLLATCTTAPTVLTLQHHHTKPRIACVTERYLTLTQHYTTSNTDSATCGLTLPYRTMFTSVSHEGPSIWHSCNLTPTTQTPRRGGGRTESSFKLKNHTHPVGNGHFRKQLTCSDDNGQR